MIAAPPPGITGDRECCAPPIRGRAAAMRLQTHRDESRSRHFDLTGGGGDPWSIDLVTITASGILVVGFVGALLALWVH
jgi:hypothetical protein